MDDKTKSHVIGESLARLYFEYRDYFTYTNSSGKAEFDFIVSKDGIIESVEVKTVSSIKSNTLGDYFEVQLKKVRANKGNNAITNFDNTYVDWLAVVNLLDNTVYVTRASDITAKSAVRVYTDKFEEV